MPITEVIKVQLIGEQAETFAALDREQADLIAPLNAKRGAMVSIVLAGESLLQAVRETPGINIDVRAREIILTPPEQYLNTAGTSDV